MTGFATPVSPAFFSSWTDTSGALRRELRLAGSGADTTATQRPISWAAGARFLHVQWVTPPLQPGIDFTGAAVTSYLMAVESNADDNAISRLGVKVVDGTGTIVRATLLSAGHYGTNNEFNTSVQSRRFAHGQPLASYVTQTGDRIVVEVGASDVSGTTPGTGVALGSSVGTLTPQNETSLTLSDPWVGFSIDTPLLYGGVTGRIERDPATIFYGESPTGGVVSELQVDLSGRAQTWGAASMVENSPAARFNITSRGSWEMLAFANQATNNVIYRYGATQFGINLLPTPWRVAVIVNSSTIGTLAISNPSATNRYILVRVAMEPNPYTTGAANARRYEVQVYQPESGAVDQAVFTGAVPSSSSSTANLFPSDTNHVIHAVRIARAFHSAEEWRRSWIE